MALSDFNSSSQWTTFLQSLAPTSQLRYTRAVSDYLDFAATQNLDRQNEESVLNYMIYLHNEQDFTTSTLWSLSSMISSFFKIVFRKPEGVLQKKSPLSVQLGLWEKQDHVTQAPILEKEEIHRFIALPSSPENLPVKVALILAVSGLLRRQEIDDLTFECMEFKDEELKVAVQRQKAVGPKQVSHFLVTDPSALAVLREYFNCFRTVSHETSYIHI